MAVSRLVNRNVIAGRGRTSMRLEPELWDALYEICERECLSPSDIVRRIEAEAHSGGRTGTVRVYLLQYFRAAATQEGHLAAGRGNHAKPLRRPRVAAAT
jgi:predicted DNA-binding ribbon-helix-helix protein